MPTATTARSRASAPRAARRVAGEATEQAKEVASTAAERGGALAQDVKQEARQLAGTVRDRAGEVSEELAVQGRSLAEDAVSQLKQQAGAGTVQLAHGFRELGEEAQALAEGRPADAPRLGPYVYRAADGLYGVAEGLYNIADDIENRGPGAVLDDLQRFARRRPGAFLLGAAVVGFGVGRMVKVQRNEPEPNQYGQQGALPR